MPLYIIVYTIVTDVITNHVNYREDVECRHEGGMIYFMCKIIKINKNGTYNIEYEDDGTRETNVKASLMRKLTPTVLQRRERTRRRDSNCEEASAPSLSAPRFPISKEGKEAEGQPATAKISKANTSLEKKRKLDVMIGSIADIECDEEPGPYSEVGDLTVSNSTPDDVKVEATNKISSKEISYPQRFTRHVFKLTQEDKIQADIAEAEHQLSIALSSKHPGVIQAATCLLELTKIGTAPWELSLTAKYISQMKKICEECIRDSLQFKHHLSERRGYPVPLSKIPISIFNAILTPYVKDVVQSYMQCDAYLISISVLWVVSRTAIQKPHRDHNTVARKSICLAFDLNVKEELGTLYLPQSHFNNVLDAAKIKVKDMEHVSTSCCFFDNYMIHAGPANLSEAPSNTRVFITFLTSREEDETYRQTILEQFKYQSEIEYPKIRLSDLDNYIKEQHRKRS